MEQKRFALGQGAKLVCRVGVAVLDCPHGGKDLVTLARERFGHEPAEPAAAAGNEHDLCWVHK
jgi:hypothetical protein